MGNCLNLFAPDDDDDPPPSMKRPPPPPAASRRLLPRSAHILPFPTPPDLHALYELGPELGRGQFGIIRKCTHRASGSLLACKSICKLRMSSRDDVADVVREISIMRRLSDQLHSQAAAPAGRCSVVRLQDVIEDALFVHLIVELCSGGELFDRIAKVKRYPEAQAASLMKSLLESLKFCHSLGIMHRDLKPENILFADETDESDIKIADFGLALEFSPGQKFSGMAGSAYYMAPEVLQGEYSEQIDVWSAGVIMYVLHCGMPPFWGNTDQGIFQAIQEGRLDLTSGPWKTISQSAKDLIAQMLCVKVERRCTPSQALEHPWFAEQMMAKSHRPPTCLVADHNQDSAMSSYQRASPSTYAKIQKEVINSEGLSSLTTAMLAKKDGYKLELNPSEIICIKVGLNKLKVALAASLDAQRLSLSDSLAKLRLQTGWTCTMITTSTFEESLMVDAGHQRYLVVHDRLRKRLWLKVMRPTGFQSKGKKGPTGTSGLPLQNLQSVVPHV